MDMYVHMGIHTKKFLPRINEIVLLIPFWELLEFPEIQVRIRL